VERTIFERTPEHQWLVQVGANAQARQSWPFTLLSSDLGFLNDRECPFYGPWIFYCRKVVSECSSSTPHLQVLSLEPVDYQLEAYRILRSIVRRRSF